MANVTPVTVYLVLYNTVQYVGWSLALFRCFTALQESGGYTNTYQQSGQTIRRFQLLSAFEILHAAAGFVRGSPLTALMQWSGRSNVLFAILNQIPQLWPSPAAAALMIVWCLSEVVRYPWYAASLLKKCPEWLTWLRYTLFIPLYPIGMVAEMAIMIQALPYLKAQKLNSIGLPNALNFGVDYHLFIKALICVYPLLWFYLYYTLLKQRSKRLGPAKQSKHH